ncbi:hypothetical protein D3C76_1210920 [compost metagenome]
MGAVATICSLKSASGRCNASPRCWAARRNGVALAWPSPTRLEPSAESFSHQPRIDGRFALHSDKPAERNARSVLAGSKSTLRLSGGPAS